MSSIIGTIDPTNFNGDGLDIIGTDGADRLFGTERGDLIDAGAGRDVIDAGQGNDSVIGGPGDDIIFGGAGNDFLEGGSGNDRIFGGDGDDIINGGAGNDTIIGGAGNDSIYGGAGSDLLFGNAGQDVFIFDIQDFADGSVDTLGDFEFGQDSIIITGLGEDDQISFDSTTGSISFNGSNIIDVKGANGTEPNIEEDDSGNYEIM